MKFFVVLAALVAVSTAYPATNAPDPDLMKDLQDFLACVDLTGIISDVSQFEENDAEVQHILDYLETDTFKNYVRAVDQEPTYLAILNDLDALHVPAYQGVNEVLEILGIEKIVPPNTRKLGNKKVGGFLDLLNTIETQDIDLQCVNNTLNTKLNVKDDTPFKRLSVHLHSDDFTKLVRAFGSSDAFNTAIAAFNKEGLQLIPVLQFFENVFHWDW